MTPKTRSVCKHCGDHIEKRNGVWFSYSRHCVNLSGHEPVAEPASTGEPRISFSQLREAVAAIEAEQIPWNDTYRLSEYVLAKVTEGSMPTARLAGLFDSIAFKAASGQMPDGMPRPSEPSPQPTHSCGLEGFGAPGDICPACEASRKNREKAAPQTSAEPPSCETCGSSDPSPGLCSSTWHLQSRRKAAAPQSVSGDAPTPEERELLYEQFVASVPKMPGKRRNDLT